MREGEFDIKMFRRSRVDCSRASRLVVPATFNVAGTQAVDDKHISKLELAQSHSFSICL